ncbi:glycosyltransferase [Tumebacillus permanentifrigoris]|uniref:Glycosyltransferase involved in cell wall biosynthesis n=1 Tax=Tumebacillus permanentifrigoris TaxID=378543 RepID=A0A316DAI6_9BACL|nr:glycosyltransferase [Tumebacillus permanentifrigoris]PWK09682.1 glycosyltransferase involved in cell wall biosynthesis [Tumebacillus permanentifrigoris]
MNADKRIALFIPTLSGGGAERVTLNLAGGFAQAGHPVDLVVADASGSFRQEIPAGVQLVDLQAGRVSRALPALVRYLKAERPPVLLSALNYANVIALLAGALARSGTKVFVAEHSSVSRTLGQRSLAISVMHRMMRFFYKRAARVVAVSEGVANDLSQHLNIGETSLKVIYNPILNDRMSELLKETVLHPWFEADDTPVVVAVGRLTAVKDFANLLRAFALTRQQVNSRLMILGEGEERGMLTALAAELGVAEDVWMPGFVSNPYAYIRQSALFVLSSQTEGLPTVLVEALACGTPVVSTDCKSGPAEILQRGRYGTLVPVRDSEALSQAMVAVLRGVGGSRELPDLSPYTLEYATNQYLRLFGY